jgi:hypothetical protein
MTPPKLRLAFGAVFWRLFLVLFVLTEVAVWNQIRAFFPGAWKVHRIYALLLFTPRSAFQAFAVAALVTIALDQVVRHLARPLVGRWYSPIDTGSGATPLGFHLTPGEAILGEAPARRRSGRGWRAGTLVLTDRLLWFFPVAWELEPWSRPVGEVRLVGSVPYRPLFGSFVRGVPDRLVVRDADSREESFALADPAPVLDWFRASGLARPTLAPEFPTPAEPADA